VEHRLRANLRGKLIDEGELPVGVTDQKESHALPPESRADRIVSVMIHTRAFLLPI
jgi:hypothetical protein